MARPRRSRLRRRRRAHRTAGIARSPTRPEIEPMLEVVASPEPEIEPYVEPVVIDEIQVPIPEMVAPTIEVVEPVAELDHAALLDQLIPIDDPDVEEMPLELVAAIAAQQAAAESQPELVASSGSPGSPGSSGSSGSPVSTDQFEIAAAVEHAELVAPESAGPVESAHARADSDELRRDSADLSAGASAGGSGLHRESEPVEPSTDRPVEPTAPRSVELRRDSA